MITYVIMYALSHRSSQTQCLLQQIIKKGIKMINTVIHTFCENQSSGRPGFPNGLIALLTETLRKYSNSNSSIVVHLLLISVMNNCYKFHEKCISESVKVLS